MTNLSNHFFFKLSEIIYLFIHSFMVVLNLHQVESTVCSVVTNFQHDRFFQVCFGKLCFEDLNVETFSLEKQVPGSVIAHWWDTTNSALGCPGLLLCPRTRRQWAESCSSTEPSGGWAAQVCPSAQGICPGTHNWKGQVHSIPLTLSWCLISKGSLISMTTCCIYGNKPGLKILTFWE